MGKNKSFDQFTELELKLKTLELEGKGKFDGKLAESFRNLEEYVHNASGYFCNTNEYSLLERHRLHYLKMAKELNNFLLDKIDVAKYEKKYIKLIDVIESKNKSYMEKVKKEIRKNRGVANRNDGSGIDEDSYDKPRYTLHYRGGF